MLKPIGDPTQPFNVGVAVTEPDTGVVDPPVVPVNGAILPLPLAPRPIEVLLFVHATVAPVGVDTNAPGATCCWSQTAISGMALSCGIGFTITLEVPTPEQPLLVLTESVTTQVPDALYVLEGLACVEVLPSPNVQLYVEAPAVVLLKTVGWPWHTGGALKVGVIVAFTITGTE
jgi:hypothetical protein